MIISFLTSTLLIEPFREGTVRATFCSRYLSLPYSGDANLCSLLSCPFYGIVRKGLVTFYYSLFVPSSDLADFSV